MKKQLFSSIIIAALGLSLNSFAQQAEPAVVTPIKVMPAATMTVPTMSNTTVVTPPKKQKRTPPVDNTANMTAAAGGGQGMVWVNTKSKVYHCFGSKYYGKTKAGSYMTAAQAEAAGNHANDKKQCTM